MNVEKKCKRINSNNKNDGLKIFIQEFYEIRLRGCGKNISRAVRAGDVTPLIVQVAVFGVVLTENGPIKNGMCKSI